MRGSPSNWRRYAAPSAPDPLVRRTPLGRGCACGRGTLPPSHLARQCARGASIERVQGQHRIRLSAAGVCLCRRVSSLLSVCRACMLRRRLFLPPTVPSPSVTTFPALGRARSIPLEHPLKHASCDLMVTASPALELHFWCQLRIASARPTLGPSVPCARMVVHVYVELSYGLPLACIPSSGLLRLAWQQLDSCIVNLGVGWPCVSGGLRSQNGTFTPSAYANNTIPSPGYVLQAMRPW